MTSRELGATKMEEDKEEDIIKEDTHIRGKQLALVSKASL